MADSDQLAVEGSGLAAVVSPSGASGTVPEGSLDEALKMGYRLATPGEHNETRKQQEYGSSPLAAAGLGALSTLSGGATDLLGGMNQGPDNLGLTADSSIQEISNRNKGARAVGEFAGLLAPVGAGGLIAKAGEKVAGSLGGKAVGTIARGVTEGSLFGVGETVSHAGLSQDPLTAESVVGDLTRNVLMGGALGGIGGGLGELAGKAAGKAREGLEKMSADLGARAAEPGERAALETARRTELMRLEEAAKPERAGLVTELKSLRADQKPLREALSARIESAPEDVRSDLVRAERSLGGIVGNAKKLTREPEAALDAVSNYATHLQDALGPDAPDLGARMLDRVKGLQQRLEALAGGPKSPALEQIDSKLAEIAKPVEKKAGAMGSDLAKDLAKGVAGAGIYGAAHEVADNLNLPGAGMLSFILAGKLAGRVGDALSTKLAARAAEVGARISSAAARVTGAVEKAAPRSFALAGALSPHAFDALRSSVLEANANPQAAQQQVNAQLEGVRLRDPALADQLSQIQMRAIQHLAQVAPMSSAGPTLNSRADAGAVSQNEKDKFMRRVEVVVDPTSLLTHLEDGSITPSQVQTADAVYTELMTTLRQRVIEQLGTKEISPHRALALSILLGAPATASLRPENIAAAQARMSSEMARAGSSQSSGSAPKPEATTAAQRLAGR